MVELWYNFYKTLFEHYFKTFSLILILCLLIASRVTSLSAAGRSYGEPSGQNQATNPSPSPNGRILSQPNTSDKDAITYPDDIIRDSYGNIVTPYTTLAEDTASLHTSPKPSNVGPLTDVSKDNGQQLQFVIPSYSDGITELQGPYKPSLVNSAIAPPLQTLLPPLSSGNYNYPSLDTHKISADNSYQNEIGGSFSSSSQSINPVPTGPTAITTNGHIGNTNNSPGAYNPNLQVPFNSPVIQPTAYDQQTGPSIQSQTQPIFGTSPSLSFSKPSFTSIPNNPQANSVAPAQGSSDFSTIHVSSPELNAPSSSFAFSNTKPLTDTQFVNQIPINIQVDNGKYTGGFGGAPGILGEQKQQGYAVKPSVNKPAFAASPPQVNNDHPGLNSVHVNSPLNSPTRGTQNALSNPPQQAILPNQNFQGNLAPAKPDNINQSGAFGQPNTNHGSFQFGTAISSNPNSQISNNGKYTGGFGGPPGIFAPFDNIKTGKNIATDNSPTSNPGNLNKLIYQFPENNLFSFNCRSEKEVLTS